MARLLTLVPSLLHGLWSVIRCTVFFFLVRRAASMWVMCLVVEAETLGLSLRCVHCHGAYMTWPGACQAMGQALACTIQRCELVGNYTMGSPWRP